MVKLIVGLKGSGKTKRLVDMVRAAVEESNGSVVCIEKERKLTYDIPMQARLIEASAYPIGTYDFMKGMLSGIQAGNYDITHVYVDNFYKLVADKDPAALEAFIAWLAAFSQENSVEYVISISADAAALPESVKAYII